MSTSPSNLSVQEQQMLIAEFTSAWDMIIALDDRRIKLVEIYTVLSTAAVGLAAASGSIGASSDLIVVLTAFVSLTVGLIGLAFRSMMSSDRRAKERYLGKINLIRSIYLKDSQSAPVSNYLGRTDLGIMTADNWAKALTRDWGRTFVRQNLIINLQIVIQILICCTFLGIRFALFLK
jgi:hypothetical protein